MQPISSSETRLNDSKLECIRKSSEKQNFLENNQNKS